MHLPLSFLVAAQTPGPADLERYSGALERGGLYTICVVLLAGLVYLYVSKERLQKDILDMVREQTAVLTKQQIVTEKVEGLLVRVNARLDLRNVCPFQSGRQQGDDP